MHSFIRFTGTFLGLRACHTDTFCRGTLPNKVHPLGRCWTLFGVQGFVKLVDTFMGSHSEQGGRCEKCTLPHFVLVLSSCYYDTLQCILHCAILVWCPRVLVCRRTGRYKHRRTWLQRTGWWAKLNEKVNIVRTYAPTLQSIANYSFFFRAVLSFTSDTALHPRQT